MLFFIITRYIKIGFLNEIINFLINQSIKFIISNKKLKVKLNYLYRKTIILKNIP